MTSPGCSSCTSGPTTTLRNLRRGSERHSTRSRSLKAGKQPAPRRAASLCATQARLGQSCIVHGTMTEKGMGSEASEKSQKSQGAVVTYSPQEHGYRDSHERVTRTKIGKRLAALKGYAFAGEYDASVCYAGPVYFIPSDTLLGGEAADLGIRSERDLFGGVVPYRFVATKAITHSLVDPNARAPTGWSDAFGHRVQDAVLFGFTVFTQEDAHYAAA